MDFRFTAEQDEAAELAASILQDRATNDRLKAVEAAGDRFDRELWAELGSAGLLGLALPEQYDGAGLGLLELCRVLVEVGRTVAPVPLAAHGPASRLLAERGPDALRERWLPRAATGAAVLTAAVAEERAYAPARPTTAATPEGDGYRITGSKAIVPAGPYADAFVVPAETATGVGVFLVEPGDAGVTVVAQTFSDRDAVARLDLDGVIVGPDRLVGEADGAADHRLRQLMLLAGCAEQLGITEGALRLTASYAKTREQFGRPIGTFQAVSQRLADGYIDVLGQRLTLWQAAWRLDEGLPADTEVAIAKLWAADAGHRVAHTTVHVHGGVGIDLDGEAHRYFTSAKRFEFLHGGATEQALNVGRALAAEPA
ncbi:acyl-CoA dehydrogenase family protein [Nocardioides sp. T2.26MG-1]|uniref:acyl-CoA dehydrogenase family protein n=1 Tax=Nocardioides sp. T2.26MG-1 TaxID=3041166 RepID=UPI0024776465|nr:acyl-CoA dehydrogenase family protein [Nocardioides sp. T2.26MG-1]CAI9415110.1 Acyl-CoA dehydrogenase FadE27 [Nocardioides sp. T2.26MG-1]